MTIWRLVPEFGFRQSIWILASGLILILCLRLPGNLHFLRHYKYLWLVSGLGITALTIFFGVNPLGNGPRLWLGCCGIYFQPSEPLKLLLVIYLAAYFADQIPLKLTLLPLMVPTILVTGVALTILVIQRDLGTASIFIFLYTIQLYISSGRKRVLLFSLIVLLVSAVLGYVLFDVVRLRVDAWLNPWLDPSGRSYQIVQSLLSIANGGLFGRGPGGGSPGLVPVAISDFIYSAISEEFGIMGTFGLLALLGIFTARGIRIALHAPDRFRRYLAAGLIAYLIGQSILIMAGGMRVLPLTGVTLPFISYGGSSLLSSFLALFLLLVISDQPDQEPFRLSIPQPFNILAGSLILGLTIISVSTGWWAIWRGPDLLTRTDNARRTISDLYVKRGSLLARQDQPITMTDGKSGSFQRVYWYPDLSPITGYTDPVFGQAGLEYSLDDYLRGIQGNNSSLVWLDHLLYGQPPPGLDVRLSINLDLQRQSDLQMKGHTGAVVLMNASSGEILVLSSHPNYDPNSLSASGVTLAQDARKPLIDRAAQGMYLPGNAIQLFIDIAGLVENPMKEAETNLFQSLGFYSSPELHLPVAQAVTPSAELHLTPLQMAVAVSTLSNDGIRPGPRLAMAVNTPQHGWVILPSLVEPVQVYTEGSILPTLQKYLVFQNPFWEFQSSFWDGKGKKNLTWFLAGTLPDWQGTPLAVVILLEENNPGFAADLGRSLITLAMQP